MEVRCQCGDGWRERAAGGRGVWHFWWRGCLRGWVKDVVLVIVVVIAAGERAEVTREGGGGEGE